MVVPFAIAVGHSIYADRRVSAPPNAHRLSISLFSIQKAREILCLIYITLKHFTVIPKMTETVSVKQTNLLQLGVTYFGVKSFIHSSTHAFCLVANSHGLLRI